MRFADFGRCAFLAIAAGLALAASTGYQLSASAAPSEERGTQTDYNPDEHENPYEGHNLDKPTRNYDGEVLGGEQGASAGSAYRWEGEHQVQGARTYDWPKKFRFLGEDRRPDPLLDHVHPAPPYPHVDQKGPAAEAGPGIYLPVEEQQQHLLELDLGRLREVKVERERDQEDGDDELGGERGTAGTLGSSGSAASVNSPATDGPLSTRGSRSRYPMDRQKSWAEISENAERENEDQGFDPSLVMMRRLAAEERLMSGEVGFDEVEQEQAPLPIGPVAGTTGMPRSRMWKQGGKGKGKGKAASSSGGGAVSSSSTVQPAMSALSLGLAAESDARRHAVFFEQWKKWPLHRVTPVVGAEKLPAGIPVEDATSFMLDYIPEKIQSQLRAEHVVRDLNQLGLYGLYDFVHVVVKNWGGQNHHGFNSKRHAPYIFVNFVNKFAASLFRQAVESDRLHCRTFIRARYADKQGFLQQAAAYASFEFWSPDGEQGNEARIVHMTPRSNASAGRLSRIRNPNLVPLIFKRVPRQFDAGLQGENTGYNWDEHLQLLQRLPPLATSNGDGVVKFNPPWTVYAFPLLGSKFDRSLLRLSFDLSEAMLPPRTYGEPPEEAWFEVGHPTADLMLDFYRWQGGFFVDTWGPVVGLYGRSWALRAATGSDFGYLLAASNYGGTSASEFLPLHVLRTLRLENLAGSFFDAALGFQKPTYSFYFMPNGVSHDTLAWIVAEADAAEGGSSMSGYHTDRVAFVARGRGDVDVSRRRAAAAFREQRIAARLHDRVRQELSLSAADEEVWAALDRQRYSLLQSAGLEAPASEA